MIEGHRKELQFDRSIDHKVGILEFVRGKPGFFSQVSDAVLSLSRSLGSYSFDYQGWTISASRGDLCPHIKRSNVVAFPIERRHAIGDRSFERAA